MRTVLSIITLLLYTTGISAQEVTRPVMSVVLNLTQRQIVFRLSWTQREQVDSTVVFVYTTADTTTTPILVRRSVSPDTIRLPAPDDTLNYIFQLRSYRNTIPSDPAQAGFYFDATRYYKITALLTKPDTIFANPGETVQLCTFFRFNDNTVVMRVRDASKPACVTEFGKLTNTSATGYKQRFVNTFCFQARREDGTIEQEPNCP